MRCGFWRFSVVLVLLICSTIVVAAENRFVIDGDVILNPAVDYAQNDGILHLTNTDLHISFKSERGQEQKKFTPDIVVDQNARLYFPPSVKQVVVIPSGQDAPTLAKEVRDHYIMGLGFYGFWLTTLSIALIVR
ncbi:MAG: hypothetical protein OEX19_13455 [Gammaproteobacteria bacterium]|nr:hypothetical protein [Gammaproteobacteria bacterium]